MNQYKDEDYQQDDNIEARIEAVEQKLMRTSPARDNHALQKIKQKLSFGGKIPNSPSKIGKNGLNLQLLKSITTRGLNMSKKQLDSIIIVENKEEEEDDEVSKISL